MQPLNELRTEIDLGIEVYPATNHDVIVARLYCPPMEKSFYVFMCYKDGTQREKPARFGPVEIEGYEPANEVYYCNFHEHKVSYNEKDEMWDGGMIVDVNECYETFEELLDDWAVLSSLPIWSTSKPPERVRIEQEERAAQERARKELEILEHKKLLNKDWSSTKMGDGSIGYCSNERFQAMIDEGLNPFDELID